MAGIGLSEECFSHGQFYVACCRVSSASSLAKIKRIKKPAKTEPKLMAREQSWNKIISETTTQ
ncbi:ATP-dependent DNA helicase PIF1-like [Aphis craccivora]|uniref:ATP-dependent DNA helicase PIF1-like n=1 Tax=Aphis craccivora TaxID=307492 RepID=A0A6G0Z5Y5_APHCR|nr:ATP-dependent DNA helicase PIF1-like [Aphis craccivora]